MNENLKGHSSRKKRDIIEQAINAVTLTNPSARFNVKAICAKVAEILCDRYSGGNLEYHSERMGMGSTECIKKEIYNYFYRDFQGEPIEK